MKKLFLAAGAALMVMGVTSCSKKSGVSAEDKAFDDSLACAWGTDGRLSGKSDGR